MGISIYVNEDTQAGRVIKRFGNARRLAEYMNCDPSRVYRWMHPREKGGTGGLIPSSSMPEVMAAARLAGLILTAQDLYPKPLEDRTQDLAPIEDDGAPDLTAALAGR